MKSHQKMKAVGNESQSSDLRILIVDDLLLDLITLQKALLPQIKGINWKEILIARNGIESFAIYQNSEKIDLILMNIQMPVMDGFEATRKIRLIDKNVIIIACSEYQYDSITDKLSESGFSGYLNKPLELKALQTIVNKFFLSSNTSHKK